MASHHVKEESAALRKLDKILSNFKLNLQAFRTVTGLFQERLFEIKAELDTWERFHDLSIIPRHYEQGVFEVMSHVFATREKNKQISQKLSSVYEQMLGIIQASSKAPLSTAAPSILKRDIVPDDDLDECDCDCMEK